MIALLTAMCNTAVAGGPLGIDHRVRRDDSGIWKRRYQLDMMRVLVVGEVAGSLWEGSGSRFGGTLWQSVDASVLGGVSAAALKKAFSRERPYETPDPGRFFQGDGHRSFPSGEVTVTTAIVTSLIAEYGRDRPAVYALGLLPLYDMTARVKTWGHWQSDVVAGFALGAAWGLYAHSRSEPLVGKALPGAFTVGFRKRF